MPVSPFTKLREAERLIKHRIEMLKKEARQLERAGLTTGRPTFNRQKYLYMYYPNAGVKGGRDRVYVGSDPEKVRSALEAVARTDRHRELKEREAAAHSLLEYIRSSTAGIVKHIDRQLAEIGLANDDSA